VKFLARSADPATYDNAFETEKFHCRRIRSDFNLSGWAAVRTSKRAAGKFQKYGQRRPIVRPRCGIGGQPTMRQCWPMPAMRQIRPTRWHAVTYS